MSATQKRKNSLEEEQFLTLKIFREFGDCSKQLPVCYTPTFDDFSLFADEHYEMQTFNALDTNAKYASNSNKYDLFTKLSYHKKQLQYDQIEDYPNQDDINNYEDENLEAIYYQQAEQFQPYFSTDFVLNTQNPYKISENDIKNKKIHLLNLNTENNTENQKMDTLDKDVDTDEGLNPYNENDFDNPCKAFFEFPDFDAFTKKDTQIQNFPKNINNTQTIQQQNQGFFAPTNNSTKQIWKVTQKIQKKKKQRDYDKNICRYLARTIIRCFVDKSYKPQVHNLCSQLSKNASDIDNLYNSSTSYLLSKIEFVTGHRAFRELLCYNEDEDEIKIQEKQVFRKFTYWFLKERAFRYIITGAMTDKQSYLKFKNEIMLLYVNRPESWTSNQKSERKR